MKKFLIIITLLLITGCGEKKKEEKKEFDAYEQTIENYCYAILRAAENKSIEYLINSSYNFTDQILFTCDGEKCSATIDDVVLDLEVTSMIPKSGEVLIDSNYIAKINKPLIINGYTCTTNNNLVDCKKY